MGIHTIARAHRDRPLRAARVRRRRGASLIDSYLDIDAVIAAAKATGADAIHPGYGFLSERSAFAQAVEDAGLVLVGPSAEVMEQMGRKDAAREIAEEAGVAVVPSYDLEADAVELRLPRPRQGRRRRWRQGHAHRPQRERVRRGGRRRASARRSRPSATTPCSSRSTSSPVATSRCRCSPTATATWSTSSSATAPPSAVTRRCSRRRRPRRSPRSSATRSPRPRSPWPAGRLRERRHRRVPARQRNRAGPTSWR